MAGVPLRANVHANLLPLNVLALMSGTSLDGVDAVLVRLERQGEKLHWQVLARDAQPYTPLLRDGLRRAMHPEHSNVTRLTQLHAEVGHAYADVVAKMQTTTSQPVDLVALSGQTIYHIPVRDETRGWHTPSTLQLGEASLTAERCRVNVYSDFRQGDMAAGGQGAPLVAFGDLHLFHEPGVTRAVHNLGGISNLTYLPADGDPEGVFAFDTGPANCLVDEAVERCYGLPYDPNGRHAARGRVDEGVLKALMAHPYLQRPPPKTTGREVFTLSELEKRLSLEHLAPDDLIATLTAFTATSIARAYRRFVPHVDEIVLAGGGALNETLVRLLRERLSTNVKTFADLGWNAKDREALAFAVMGYFALHGLPNTLPSATGARRAVVAGKLNVATV